MPDKDGHISVTTVIPISQLQDYEKADETRRVLGEQAWAEAQRKLLPSEKPEWVDDAVRD
jgi:hypothetical protein